MVFLVLLMRCCLPVFAQEKEKPFGYLENGRFAGEFQKYLELNAYEKIFNWSGELFFDLGLLRYRNEELRGFVAMQPVIAHSYDRRIRVSGQVYRFGFSYRHQFSNSITGDFFIDHISTHITKDLDDPFYLEVPPLPKGLLDDTNLIGLLVRWRDKLLGKMPFETIVAFQPLAVKLPDVWSNEHYKRPFYCSVTGGISEWYFLRLVLNGQVEVGDKRQSMVKLEGRLELISPAQPDEGRLLFFIGKFLGPAAINTSPRFGFSPTNFYLGIRTVFCY